MTVDTIDAIENAQTQAMEVLTEEFRLSPKQLKEFASTLKSELDRGLQVQDGSAMPMLPSWVVQRPSGQETGEFLGLELNGKYLMRGG